MGLYSGHRVLPDVKEFIVFELITKRNMPEDLICEDGVGSVKSYNTHLSLPAAPLSAMQKLLREREK